MLNALKFVQGAVAKKDLQPVLKHFRIANGRVIGYNGVIALSSPIDLDIEATPSAIPFVHAIERCVDDTTVINMSSGNKLSLRSGGFRAYVECADDSDILDSIQPEGEEVEIDEDFLIAMRVLRPFVGTDASRPWATGILLRGDSAFATNNIILGQYWIGHAVPEVNIPGGAVDELLRIRETPEKIMISPRNITFFFSGDRWLRSQVLATEWPDVAAMLNAAFKDADFQPFPEGLFEAVDKIRPFVEIEGRVFFREGMISTAHDGEVGASVELETAPDHGAYHYRHLLSIEGVFDRGDLSKHPLPCPILGQNLRGVILGMVEA